MQTLYYKGKNTSRQTEHIYYLYYNSLENISHNNINNIIVNSIDENAYLLRQTMSTLKQKIHFNVLLLSKLFNKAEKSGNKKFSFFTICNKLLILSLSILFKELSSFLLKPQSNKINYYVIFIVIEFISNLILACKQKNIIYKF